MSTKVEIKAISKSFSFMEWLIVQEEKGFLLEVFCVERLMQKPIVFQRFFFECGNGASISYKYNVI